jgi:hypothetical protein
MTKVRILTETQLDGVNHPADTVLDLVEDVAAELVNSGAADDSEAAVAYAESLVAGA